MKKTVEYSGCAKTARQTDMTAPQDLLTTSRAVGAAGLTRCQSAAATVSLLMKKDQNSSAQDRQQQGSSPSTPTLQIVGSTSCVLLECPGSMAVPWEVSSMLDQGLELMENVLIQRKFLSVQIIMEISSLTPMSFLEMGSTQEDRRTQKE